MRRGYLSVETQLGERVVDRRGIFLREGDGSGNEHVTVKMAGNPVAPTTELR